MHEPVMRVEYVSGEVEKMPLTELSTYVLRQILHQANIGSTDLKSEDGTGVDIMAAYIALILEERE